MNKEWFIFKVNHHVGPYSLAELQKFVQNQELHEKSLVWREGAEKWESLGKTKELVHLLELAPLKVDSHQDEAGIPSIPVNHLPKSGSLPPLAAPKIKNNNQVKHKIQSSVVSLEDEPPPIPLDAILNPKGEKNLFVPKIKSHSWKLMFWSSFVAIFFAVVTWFFMNENSSSVSIKIPRMMPVYSEKLQEIASLKTPAFSLGMALDLEGENLYATTNKTGEIIAVIKMQSLPKRILGVEATELLVKGKIKNHLGKFEKMQIVKGSKFVPGEYKVSFSGRKMHFLNENFPYLRQFSFFKKMNGIINYETTALIYKGTPRDFEKKLIEYRVQILAEQLKPYQDKLERFQTFQSLLNKTMEEYLIALDKIKKPKDISQFETMYIREISPVVQSLVVAASELSSKLENNQSEIIGSYKSQMYTGKLMGELASDMITMTMKSKKITKEDKKLFQEKFEKRFKTIKNQIESSISILEDQIEIMSK